MAPRRRDDNGITPADVQSVLAAFQRLPPWVQLAVAVLLLIGGLIAAAIWWQLQRQATHPGPTGTAATGSPHLLLGNPSNATDDPTQPDNYLMVKPYFALSYNEGKGTPNWVSWRVTAADLGTAPRRDDFLPDDTLPAAFRHITSHDYDRSGFDRGHMCPHGDRQSDLTASYATFVMSNVIPQAPNVNQKAWDQEEMYCRQLVRGGHRLYVTAGPAGRGGVGRNGPRDTLANGRVTVPSDCWKVVVVLDDDPGYDPDPATLSATTRVLTVDVPNDHDVVGESWEQYRTTPADVERRTGLRFFDRLRPDVADALRQRVDRMPLPPPVPQRRGGD